MRTRPEGQFGQAQDLPLRLIPYDGNRIYREGKMPIDKKPAVTSSLVFYKAAEKDNHRNNPPVNMHGRAVI